MKKLVFFVILLVAAGGSAWYYFKYAKPVEKPQVMQAAITRGDIVEQVSATGTLEPLRRVDVGSQVSGVVQELFVDFNTIVRQGMVLAKIDPTLLQVQVEIQKANIQRQEGDIANQEVQLEDVRKQLERTRAMFDKGLQNQQQLEQAELSVKTRQAQIDSAKKSLIQARANLQQAELNVEYTTIKSPIDGVVVERKVDRGQTVQASMSTPSFFVLATDLRELKLTAMVDESEIGKIRPGMDVTFQVDAYGQNQFPGKVDAVRLNAMTQNNVVTYPVWINAPNPDLRLRPSMTATVFIHVSNTADAIRIPNEALRFRPTRALYAALGLPVPQDPAVRAVDLAADRLVNPTAPSDIAVDPEAESIDELFAPLPRADARAAVWSWDQANRELVRIPVRVGVSDGTVTELLSGDVDPGDQLVIGVIPPEAPQDRPAQNPLLNPGRRGRGGR